MKRSYQGNRSQPRVPGEPFQDEKGTWWYQDPASNGLSFWNGQTWQPYPGTSPQILAPTPPLIKKRRGWASCLFALIISGMIGLIVVGGISLVAFGFIPQYQISMGSGDFNQILKMGGGGLLVTVLGLFLINGGLKAIITRRAIVEDDWGRRREKRGCGAIFNGLGQLVFGILLTIGGFGMITIVFYQEVIPWLGI